MNQTLHPITDVRTRTAWRLWIDRCGGYGLHCGDVVTVGGARPDSSTAVQLRADWRRLEGRLARRGGDYFWTPENESHVADQLVHSGSVLPIDGSAQLTLTRPSPLSASAVLRVAPPHRFAEHVDQVLLVDQTILIGPTASDHIRCTTLECSAILVLQNGHWRAKLKSNVTTKKGRGAQPKSQFVDLVPGERISLGDLDMMLEHA